MRQEIYAESVQKVRELNKKSRLSGKRNAAKFAINFFADLTLEEKKKWAGLQNPDLKEQSYGKLYHKRDDKGRRLIADATHIDHVKDGIMTPVKS